VNLSVVLRWDSLLFFKGKNIERTDGEEIFLKESKTTHFREVFNLIFYSNKDILVTLHPKTTSFWVFHPFSRFHLTEGAKL
jgi:hypothetical protein